MSKQSKEQSRLLNDCLHTLEQSRGVDREFLLSVLEEALLMAARKATKYTRDVSVTVDHDTCEYKCFAKLFVVDKVTQRDEQISLKEAQRVYPDAKIGDEVSWEIFPDDFGRIAATTAYQLLTQRLSTEEKRNICEMFRDQVNSLITGEVVRIDKEGVVISFPSMNGNGSVEGVLRREDRIPGENFETGDMVVALLTEINPDKVGARPMTISRSVPEFVAKLFEREVTEISDGLVTIKAVARDPGYRTKIAVYSNEPRIDSVGACVGMRGNRVRNVVRELGGEKVDIIEWSPDLKTFVTNALKPAKLQSISINEETKTVTVVVPEDQLSLSIGKKGQNARLASRLTGWRMDIVKEDTPEVEADDYESRVRRAIEKIGAVEGIGLEAAETLVRNGFASLEGIVAVVDIEDIANLPGFDHARAEQVVAAAKAAL